MKLITTKYPKRTFIMLNGRRVDIHCSSDDYDKNWVAILGASSYKFETREYAIEYCKKLIRNSSKVLEFEIYKIEEDSSNRKSSIAIFD